MGIVTSATRKRKSPFSGPKEKGKHFWPKVGTGDPLTARRAISAGSSEELVANEEGSMEQKEPVSTRTVVKVWLMNICTHGKEPVRDGTVPTTSLKNYKAPGISVRAAHTARGNNILCLLCFGLN